MEKKKIAILMGTYNGEKYIQEQLESIIHQTCDDWCLYIHDDGSTDNTLGIIRNYMEIYPNKIILIDKRAKRIGAKYNFSLLFDIVPEHSYYMFADQDDVWKVNKLEYMLNIIEERKEEIPLLIYSDLIIVDKNLKIINSSYREYTNQYLKKNNRLEQLLIYNVIPGCSMLFNHALRIKTKHISEKCLMHDWWIVLVAQCFGNIIDLKKKLVLYRQHDNNTLGATELKKISFFNEIMKVIQYKKLLDNKRRISDHKQNLYIQTKSFLENYPELSEKQVTIIKKYLSMLHSKKIINVINAFIYKFETQNKINTIKFWLS